VSRFFIIALLLLATRLTANAQQADFALPSVEAEKNLPGEGALRRYSGYVKNWPKLRSKWAARKQQDQDAVVFLGDSITQGWGDKFRGHFEGMKLANRGISGDTTRGMLIRLQEDVIALNPSAVVILMGTNDIGAQISPDAIARNFEKILAALKAHNPAMPIVLCRMFPSSEAKKRPSETIQKVNQLFGDIVRNDSQITVIDTFKLFDDGTGNANPKYCPDLLHLNSEGYAKWAGALTRAYLTERI